MLCFGCGKETENLYKICDRCAEARAAAPEPIPDYVEQVSEQSGFPFVQAFFTGMFILAVYLSLELVLAPSPIAYGREENSITISDGSQSMMYRIGSWKQISGRVIDAPGKDLGMKGGGAARFVMYLSEQEYDELDRSYLKTGKCPAAFLNQHSKTLALIPGKGEIAERLKSLNLRRGDRIVLEGATAAFQEGRYKGMPMTVNLGNAALFSPSRVFVNREEVLLRNEVSS